jgi:hypothetical protein
MVFGYINLPQPQFIEPTTTEAIQQVAVIQQPKPIELQKKIRTVTDTMPIAQLGDFIPIGFGTPDKFVGQCNWLGTKNKAENTIDFALAICYGPIVGFRRIWLASKLIYKADTLDGKLPLLKYCTNYREYYGTEDQLPDPAIVAKEGAENVSGWLGLVFILIKGFKMELFNDFPMWVFEPVFE